MLNITSRSGMNKQSALIGLLQSWATGEQGKHDMMAIYDTATAYESAPNRNGDLPGEDNVLCNLEGLITRYMGRKIGLMIERNRKKRAKNDNSSI